MRRIAVRVAIGMLVLMLGLAAVIAAFPIVGWVPLVLVINLFANSKPPTILADQLNGASWNNLDATSQRLTNELQRKFPNGTNATSLKSAFIHEGFVTLPPPQADCIPRTQPVPTKLPFSWCPTAEQERVRKQSLVYYWGGLPCSQSISLLGRK